MRLMRINQNMIKYILTTGILLFCLFTGCNSNSELKIDLSGEWQFQTDPEDRGVEEERVKKELPETVSLPGSMAENGKGDDITLETRWTGGINNREWYNDPKYAPYVDPDNVRFPFWLQPEKK